ncbi:hypothetical protein ILYODFUR_014745, partial [Ilyodon furcidens]
QCATVCQLYEYLDNKEENNWTEAQQHCREKHTDLATVSDMGDMKRLLNISARGVKDAWIGLYNQTRAYRKWHWSLPGVEFDKSKQLWNRNEPNDAKGMQNCGIMWKNLNGQCARTVFDDEGRWKNENCALRKPFICYDAREFILVKENKTLEDALSYCRDHYHDLVTITNPDEQRWVQQKAQFALTHFVWMGLHYACTLDLWFWVSDKVVSYKNCASDGLMDDCDMSGAMEKGRKHQWFKRNYTERLNFICSRKRQGK